MPKISIVMPAYNDAKYIEFAINSVCAQTFTDWELIIVDDGSVDNTATIAEEYAKKDSRIHFYKQTNQKTVAARNNAIGKSNSEYIFPLDADDRIAPKCLEVLYNKIINSNYSVVAPGVARFDRYNGLQNYPRPTKFNMCIRNCIVNSSLFRKSDWEKYGGYDPEFIHGFEDYAFWMNFIRDGKKIFTVSDVLFFYRMKPENTSRQKNADNNQGAELANIILKKFNFMRFYRNINSAIHLKPTTNFYIIKIFGLSIFAIPRIKMMKTIKLYFFNGRANFGDILNVYIARDLFKLNVKKTDPKFSECVFIGSLLTRYFNKRMNFGRLLHKYMRRPVKVWGTGFIEPEKEITKAIRRFDIHAVRGKITRDRLEKYTGCKLENIPMGDPGLLSSRLIDSEKIEKKYDLGIILHYVDQDSDLLEKIKIENKILIDIHLPAYDFLEKVAQCRNILSSAMHGLIASDSLGVPNARIILTDKVLGGDYKFNDYYSAFGLDSHPRIDLNEISEFKDIDFIKNNYKISQKQVEEICNKLVEVFPYNKVKK